MDVHVKKLEFGRGIRVRLTAFQMRKLDDGFIATTISNRPISKYIHKKYTYSWTIDINIK